MLLNIDEKPPDWLPPLTHKPKPYALGGAAEILNRCRKNGITSPSAPVTKTRLQSQQEERSKTRAILLEKFNEQLNSWNPKHDQKISGDPACTLFLARLPYQITEEDIKQEFGKYGSIRSVRLVEPRRGYAFILYTTPDQAIAAVQETAGNSLFRGRRIIVDLERGRLQPNWKPRRLGGGLGGRLSAARQRMEIARTNLIMRKGVRSPALEGRPAYNSRRPAPYDRTAHSNGPRGGPRGYPRSYSDNRYSDNRYTDNRYSDNRHTDHRHTDNRHTDNRLSGRLDSSGDGKGSSNGSGNGRTDSRMMTSRPGFREAQRREDPRRQPPPQDAANGRTLRQY